MKAKLFLALASIFAIATSASADFTISDAGSISNVVPSLTPQGDYFVAPGLGNAGGFFFSGGPFVDSTFDGAVDNIGADQVGTGSVLSSDLVTVNGDGTVNVLLTLSGDLFPGGFADAGGVPLDTAAVFYGASGGGTSIDFGAETVLSANLDAFAAGASIFGGPTDLVPLGFDVQSGGFGVSFGAGTAGIGIDTVTLDITVTKAIPEPTSLAVLGMLGIGLVARRRR